MGKEGESKKERKRNLETGRQRETSLASDSWKVAPGFPKNVRWLGG